MDGRINALFNNLVTVGTAVAVSVAVFFIMLGAYHYMSANGSPHQMERGKTAIVNALMGLAIVILARTIASALQSALGG